MLGVDSQQSTEWRIEAEAVRQRKQRASESEVSWLCAITGNETDLSPLKRLLSLPVRTALCRLLSPGKGFISAMGGYPRRNMQA